MKKLAIPIVMALLCLNFSSHSQIKPDLILKGVVSAAANNKAIQGATVKTDKSSSTVQTNENGEFILKITASTGKLTISHMGFKTIEVPFNLLNKSPFRINLESDSNTLEEVTVSTGYQTVPKERATGSFVQLDSTLLNRRVSTNILDRIEDVVPGLSFSKNNSGLNFYSSQSSLNIRGQSTIMGNANPLIVIDNFPYAGDLSNINPNDVESITVLKDAASASIWGAKAGNGVIVITTKKGKMGQGVKVSFNSNVTIGNKPDLFYQPQMSSADFIEIEKSLFDKGYYQNTELSTSYSPLSPVVELLIAKRDQKITAEAADLAISEYAKYDTRNDLQKYVYRRSLNQQYALNLRGGNAQNAYYISTGYDKNNNNLKGEGYDRFSLNARNTILLLKDKLNITAGISLISSQTQQGPPAYNAGFSKSSSLPYYPYARLADDQGNPVSVVKDYRTSFVSGVQERGLLDWAYKPLEEIDLYDAAVKLNEYRINTSLKYQIIPSLSAEVLYQYTNNAITSRNLQSQQSYYTRSLINRFTQADGDVLSYPVPVGGILDLARTTTNTNNIRGQLNYADTYGKDHELNAIAGYEVQDLHTLSNTSRLYGYNPINALNRPVDYLTAYNVYTSTTGSTATIPFMDAETDLTDRYISYYANAAYTYKKRYTLSGSGRLDRSNIFGVKTNQKGVPLYSAGFAWNIANEDFYQLTWLPELKLRSTFGYNGNVYNKLSAYTTATSGNYYSVNPNTGLPYATITNPPNPELRWERVKVMNLGVDFGSRNRRLSGSFDYYIKNGKDLIGTSPYDPTTGINSFTGNNADTRGRGFDLILNSRNTVGVLHWETSFIMAYNKTTVSKFETEQNGDSYILNYGQPLAGKPLLAIYSYAWAGLDPLNGDPQGYLNDVISKDYLAIRNNATPDNIIYHGSATPKYFGSLRNTFSYRSLSLSVNIAYRLGYYFRKNTINYGSLLQAGGGHGDYNLRWQNPGDEAFTFVPSLPALNNANREIFYRYSEALVARADHIRLQDVNLSWSLNRQQFSRLPFANLQVYGYVNNIGLIWKKNDFGIDPDNQVNGPIPTTFSLGLKADF